MVKPAICCFSHELRMFANANVTQPVHAELYTTSNHDTESDKAIIISISFLFISWAIQNNKRAVIWHSMRSVWSWMWFFFIVAFTFRKSYVTQIIRIDNDYRIRLFLNKYLLHARKKMLQLFCYSYKYAWVEQRKKIITVRYMHR